MHLMTSYHQTDESGFIISLWTSSKERVSELFFSDSQSPRSFCTQIACSLHFCFSDSASVLQVARTRAMACARWILPHPGLGRIHVWAAVQCQRHLTPPGRPDPTWESLCACPQNIKPMSLKGLQLSHFCDFKRLWLSLQYALPWAYIHNALVKLSVLFEYICIFTSMWFTNTRDALLEKQPHRRMHLTEMGADAFTALQYLAAKPLNTNLST